MSNGIKTIGMKVSAEYHQKIKEKADSQGLSISDFIRDAVEYRFNEVQPPSEGLARVPTEVQQVLEDYRHQLMVKDDQIKQTSEARSRSDMIIMQLTQQLDRANLQLEDMRERKTVWRRLKAVFVAETV